MPPVPHCASCAAAGTRTRPGATLFRRHSDGTWLCEDHLPAGARVASRGTAAGHAIVTEGLTKRFGATTAVDGLSITVPRGGVVGFVGPNGAGKTTTIRMLMGLARPTAGSATVLGEGLAHPSRYLGRVGALIESPAFYPALSGRRNLVALARLSGNGMDRVDEMLAQVNLAEWGGKAYRSYSLGMKQRLGIAAALLSDPELLILDEPTNGLDPAGIHEMRDFLVGLGRKGKTVFVSSHLMAEVQKMCERLVVLRRGRLVFEGTVDALLRRHAGIIASARDPRQNRRLAELCAAAGRKATLLADGTVLAQAPPEWAAELNQRAMQAGMVLSLLQPRAFDLEETVLEMTGAGEP